MTILSAFNRPVSVEFRLYIGPGREGQERTLREFTTARSACHAYVDIHSSVLLFWKREAKASRDRRRRTESVSSYVLQSDHRSGIIQSKIIRYRIIPIRINV